jgi:RimJ/RimL family protein N-acetyltransferase
MLRRPDPGIRTRRLLIREPEERDLDAVVAGIGDYRVSQWLGRVPYPYGRGDAESWLAQVTAGNAEGSQLAMLIEHDGRVVGGMGLHGLDGYGRVEDFGYWIACPWWGAGIATEAAEAVLRFAFGPLGAARVPSGVFVGNGASLRLQEKLGFDVVGSRPVMCLARGTEVMRTDTLLTRERFLAATRRQ